jgi:hypothetical protein
MIDAAGGWERFIIYVAVVITSAWTWGILLTDLWSTRRFNAAMRRGRPEVDEPKDAEAT